MIYCLTLYPPASNATSIVIDNVYVILVRWLEGEID